MTWLLVLVMITPGGNVEAFRAGHMADRDTCVLAGDSMAKTMAQINPTAVFKWQCFDMGVSA